MPEMRVSRAKQIRKHLRFYRIVYGLVPPYAVGASACVAYTHTHTPNAYLHLHPYVSIHACVLVVARGGEALH